MHKDTTIPFTNPAYRDELSELVREGAQRIIRQAVEAELGSFLEEHSTERDRRGRRAVVRNGYLPSREVLTGSARCGFVFPGRGTGRARGGASARSCCRRI